MSVSLELPAHFGNKDIFETLGTIFWFLRTRKFAIVDLQNATLSGGVAVGAVADLMVQPYTAFILGSIAGTVSTLGFRALQVPYVPGFFNLFNLNKLIDT